MVCCSCTWNPFDIANKLWDRTEKIRRLEENLESLQKKMDELDRVYNGVNRHAEEAKHAGWSLHDEADGWLKRVNGYREDVKDMKDGGAQKMGSCCLCSVCSRHCYALHELSRKAKKMKDDDLKSDLELGRTLAADKNKVAYEPPIKRVLDEIGQKRASLQALFKGVEDEEWQRKFRTDDVGRWMKYVSEILQDVEKLEDEHRKGTVGTVSQSDQREGEQLVGEDHGQGTSSQGTTNPSQSAQEKEVLKGTEGIFSLCCFRSYSKKEKQQRSPAHHSKSNQRKGKQLLEENHGQGTSSEGTTGSSQSAQEQLTRAEKLKADLVGALDRGRKLKEDAEILGNLLQDIGRKKAGLHAIFEGMKEIVEAGKLQHRVPISQLDLWMQDIPKLLEDTEQLIKDHGEGTEGTVSQVDQRSEVPEGDTDEIQEEGEQLVEENHGQGTSSEGTTGSSKSAQELLKRAEKLKPDLEDALDRGHKLKEDAENLGNLLQEIDQKKALLYADFNDMKRKVEDGKGRHEEPKNRVDLWMQDIPKLLEDTEQFLGENHGRQGTSQGTGASQPAQEPQVHKGEAEEILRKGKQLMENHHQGTSVGTSSSQSYQRAEVPEGDKDETLQQGEQLVEENHGQGTLQGAVGLSQSDQRNADLHNNIKRAKTLKAKLDQMLEEHGNIKEFTCMPKETVILELPLEPPVGAKSMFEKVWNWVDGDESVRCIGLYGMGGVGKTTLLERVCNQLARVDHDYDYAFWVEVHNRPDLDKIQKDIWKQLKLTDSEWENRCYRSLRAGFIKSKLKGKNFLLFLDDLWEKIDLLKDVGIPRDHHPTKCKIIFTTRDESVCNSMKPDKTMMVDCLKRDEARELFKKEVGEPTWNAHPRIPEIAEELVHECQNLPLAIITVARAMSGKTDHIEWMDAKKELKTRLSEFKDMEEKVLKILKFSYDWLPDDAHRKCFSYLTIFPENGKIDKDDAIRLWVGEGFVERIADGRKICSELRQASLVGFVSQDDGYGEIVKMHDLVREMAVWVYSTERGQKENRVLVRKGSEALQGAEHTTMEKVERIFLWQAHGDLWRSLLTASCPSLSTLILRETVLLQITDELFRSMPKLRVLDLSNNVLGRLPDSIWNLTELRYLNLDIKSPMDLNVDLRKIVHLRELKVLILPRDFILFVGENTEAAKSTFSFLRVFHWYNISWPLNTNSPNIAHDEMKVVDALLMQTMMEEICITLCSGQGVEKLMRIPKLHSHLIKMDVDRCQDLSTLEFSTSYGSEGFKRLLFLNLKYCGIQDIRIDNGVSFDGLRDVAIVHCHKLRDLTQLFHRAPYLEGLHIHNCKEMRAVIDRDIHVTSNRPLFSRLEVLEVRNLPKLESIYTRALPFPSLKEVRVSKCPELKKLPLDRNSAEHTLPVITGNKKWWDSLVWEDPALKQVLSAKYVEDLFDKEVISFTDLQYMHLGLIPGL